MENASGRADLEQQVAALPLKQARDIDAAYALLHVAFVAVFAIAGLDKFFHMLTDWDKYLASSVVHHLPIGVHGFMTCVGFFEIGVGMLLLYTPRIGGIAAAGWLFATASNLIAHGGPWDLVVGDLILCLAALALARLAAFRTTQATNESGSLDSQSAAPKFEWRRRRASKRRKSSLMRGF
jgi:hypothetical protein